MRSLARSTATVSATRSKTSPVSKQRGSRATDVPGGGAWGMNLLDEGPLVS